MRGLLFAHPEWLWPLCAIVGGAGLALLLAGVRGRRRLRAVIGEAPARAHAAAIAATRRDVATLVVLALVALALAGPRFGRGTVQLSTSGIDVVLLLDLSRSMDARDTPPSRLGVARRNALGILGGLGRGDRAALAAFSGRGALLTPLTPDHAALAEMIEGVDTSLVRPGGSDLSSGVRSALGAFESGSRRPRAIFVVTDGETAPEADDVEAVLSNTRVFALAVGSDSGSTIPDHGVPLRNSAGEVVTTRRHVTTLESLTARTGGALFVADEWGHFALDQALRELRAPVALAADEFVSQTITVPVVIPFAAVAAALLWIQAVGWLPLALATRWRAGRRGPGRRTRVPQTRDRRRRATAVAIGSSLLLAAGEPTPRRDVVAIPPPSATEALERALARAAEGAWPEAERGFRAAAILARDSELAAIAYHDLGVSALRRQDLETARDAFFDALSDTRGRSTESVLQTRWNLEWTLEKLAETHAEDPATRRGSAPGDSDPSEPERREEDHEVADDESGEDAEAPGTPEDETVLGSRDAAHAEQPDAEPDARMSAREDARHEEPGALPGAERSEWLQGVRDDPRRSLLSAVNRGQPPTRKRRSGTPTW